jgi:hypothetical protein
MSGEIYRDALFALGLLAGGIAFGTQLNVLTNVLPGLQQEDGETGVRLHCRILDHAAHTATVIPAVSVVGAAAVLLLIAGGSSGELRSQALLAAPPSGSRSPRTNASETGP